MRLNRSSFVVFFYFIGYFFTTFYFNNTLFTTIFGSRTNFPKETDKIEAFEVKAGM